MYLVVLISLLMSQSVWSVEASRIWLPKKYSEVKPKLMAAAQVAEETERCNTVVNGEMIVRKNTDEDYYFVITCRDQHNKTYNLTYLYPVVGNNPDLLAEQGSSTEQTQTKAKAVDIESSSVNKEQALKLCLNSMASATKDLEEITIKDKDIKEVEERDNYFFYQIPFSTKTELGSPVIYRAECQVTLNGETGIQVILENEGALSLCKDSLRAEAVLYGRISLVEDEVTQLPAVQRDGFHFQLPFEVKNRIGTVIRYGSECVLSAKGDSEITIGLLAPGALAICKEGLRTETLLMKAVNVAKAPSAESFAEGYFNFDIPFTANDPEGNQRNFKAVCQVDEDGDAYVETEIDPSAIFSVCVSELKNKTEKMKNVVILDGQSPILKRTIDDGYVGIIPFNAVDPAGRPLYYQAECRVDGSGRSQIKLSGRKY
jgi:hypothetical protein